MTGATDDKPCPRCAEMIKAKAAVCRFCGHEMELGQPQAAPAVSEQAIFDSMFRRQRPSGGPKQYSPAAWTFQGCFGCLGAALVILLLLIALPNIIGRVP